MKKNIVDVFPFFNEKELLELRVRMLEPYVDQFVISEANRTHSGMPKEFILNKLIDELGLPKEKIRVLEVDLYAEEAQTPAYIDICHATSAKSEHDAISWTRERLQRDAIAKIIDEYDDDTVFIMSDCDEIIDPEVIDFLASMTRKNPDIIVRVPLRLLESRADLQVMNLDDTPVPWDESMFLCMKHHIKATEITLLKANKTPNEFSPWQGLFICQDGQRIENLGWHFTWMGDRERRLYKSQSFIHHSNLNVVNNVSKDTIDFLSENLDQNIVTDKQFKLVKIDYSLLPETIFEYPHIKEFLLGDNTVVVNYFPYTGDKDLLDLRIKLLYNKIDLFVIEDLNGHCEQALNELGIPKDKISINGEIPKQAFCYVTDDNEILNPLFVDYYISLIKKHTDVVFRVPLSTDAGTNQHRNAFLCTTELLTTHGINSLRNTAYEGAMQVVVMDNGIAEPAGWKLANPVEMQKIQWPTQVLNTPKFENLFKKYGYLH